MMTDAQISSPYKETERLYTMHFFFTFVSRMWDMGIILLIAELTMNSLFIVALAGFFSSLSIFLLSHVIGKWLDRTDR